MRKGSKVKATHDITWEVLLGMAAPSTIIDRVLVPAGTTGEVTEYDKENNLYLVEFGDNQEWYLEKESIE
jgi:hypothetical protein